MGFFDGADDVPVGTERHDALSDADYLVEVQRHVLIDSMQVGKHAGEAAIIVEMKVLEVQPLQGRTPSHSVGQVGNAFFRLPSPTSNVGKTLWQKAQDHFRALLRLPSGQNATAEQLSLLFKPTPEQQKALLAKGIPFGPEAFAGTQMRLRVTSATSNKGVAYLARQWSYVEAPKTK